MSDTPGGGAPPQFSPDGNWWWDGTNWVPASQAPASGAPEVQAPPPASSAVERLGNRIEQLTSRVEAVGEQQRAGATTKSAPSAKGPGFWAGWPLWVTVVLGILVWPVTGFIFIYRRAWTGKVKWGAAAGWAAVCLVALIIGSTASTTTSDNNVASSSSSSPSPAQQVATQHVATSPVTASKPSPSPQAVAAASPKPAADPHALTAANVAQSVRDNQSFSMYPSNFDKLNVTIQGNKVTVAFTPANILDENNSFDMEAADTLIAIKAIWGWYPAAQEIVVEEHSSFTDQYGHSQDEVAEGIDYQADTLSKVDINGLKERADSEGDHYLMYEDADGYYVHPAVWKNVSNETKGDLTDFCSSYPGQC